MTTEITMKNTFLRSWKRSVQQRKQRKYHFYAPLHIKQHFLGAHLSRDLRQKYGRRSFPLRTGDEVRIVRGQFKGKSGKVRDILLRREKVLVEGIEVSKADGSKRPFPVHPSNLLLTTFNLENPKRKKKAEMKMKEAKDARTASGTHSVGKEEVKTKVKEAGPVKEKKEKTIGEKITL